MLHTLLDAVFPRYSLEGSEGTHMTSLELQSLHLNPALEDQRSLRERGIVHLDCLRAACSYRHNPLLKKAVWQWKYKGRSGFDVALALLLTELAEQDDDTVLCPVPLHWTRQFSRGFNQSEKLCRELSRQSDFPVQRLLQRRRSTGFQSHRSRRERLSALEDVFVCRGHNTPHRVVLIDDLCTTGSTLDACAKALKQGGVAWVEGWTLALG